MAYPAKPFLERFWAMVDIRGPDECWPWLGAIVDGYGVITRIKPTRKLFRAHRVSWEIHKGPIPAGISVLHICDNRPCCNPNDLYLGTHLDNMRDRDERGGTLKGEAHPRAKLTDKDVLRIAKLLEDGIHELVLAEQFGVSRSAIGFIRRRENWRHVLGGPQ